MGRIPLNDLINRLVTLCLTVFIAATLIWIIPRLSPIDPSTSCSAAWPRAVAPPGARTPS